MTGLLDRRRPRARAPGRPRREELTIFWAEWDPANYLQELVNEYAKETGVKVTVETTPWSDFQTKAFTEFNAKGDAYDMVVGDSQWLGAGSTGGHYVDLTDFFKKHKLDELMAPATVKYYAEYPSGSGKYWAIPLEGDADRLGLSQGLVRGPEGDGGVQGEVRLRPRRAEGLQGSCATSPSSSIVRTRSATASRIYTDNSYDAMAMGVERRIFTYGGELGDYATYKVDGIINSDKAIAGARGLQASSTSSRRRAGARRSSWRTTRRSPRAWRR